MKNETIKTICKTLLIALLIYTTSTTIIALFNLGLWPFALLVFAYAIIASIIYLIVYLVKMRGYRKINQEISELKNRIDEIEKREAVSKSNE